MDKQQTKDAIKVMQAFVDGKTIQLESKGVWFDAPDRPSWNWASQNYRVKPEPVVVYINEYPGEERSFEAYDTKEMAENLASCNCLRVAVKFQEVIE